MGVGGNFTVVAAPDIKALKIPSDLGGYIMLPIDPAKIGDETYISEQVDIISQNIKSRSRAAALSLLPSAALAYGYFNNFLRPVYDHLKAADHIEIAGQSRDIRKGNYELVVLLPQSVQGAEIDARDKYVKDQELLPLKFSAGKREYGCFAYKPVSDGIVRLADYPTTLRASIDIIQLTMQEAREAGGSIEFAAIRERMGRQEIANFRKALGTG